MISVIFGIEILVNDVPYNTYSSNVRTLLGTVMVVIEIQFLKAFFPNAVGFPENVIVGILEQFSKTLLKILVTPDGIVTPPIKLEHPENALAPKVVTEDLRAFVFVKAEHP